MRKWFSWVPEFLSNTRVSISLEGWPAAVAVTGGCATVLGGLYLLLKAGVLQHLGSDDQDD